MIAPFFVFIIVPTIFYCFLLYAVGLRLGKGWPPRLYFVEPIGLICRAMIERAELRYSRIYDEKERRKRIARYASKRLTRFRIVLTVMVILALAQNIAWVVIGPPPELWKYIYLKLSGN